MSAKSAFSFSQFKKPNSEFGLSSDDSPVYGGNPKKTSKKRTKKSPEEVEAEKMHSYLSSPMVHANSW